MTKKEERFYLRWNRRRARGKFKYMAWRALVTGVIAAIILSVILFASFYVQLSQEDFVIFLLQGSWLAMLILFLVMTLFSLWFYSIIFDMRCRKFESLVRTTSKGQLPKDYSVTNAPGIAEAFPDFSWETPSVPKENHSEPKKKQN